MKHSSKQPTKEIPTEIAEQKRTIKSLRNPCTLSGKYSVDANLATAHRCNLRFL